MAGQFAELIQAVNSARDTIVKHLIRMNTYVSESVGLAASTSAVSATTGALTVS